MNKLKYGQGNLWITVKTEHTGFLSYALQGKTEDDYHFLPFLQDIETRCANKLWNRYLFNPMDIDVVNLKQTFIEECVYQLRSELEIRREALNRIYDIQKLQYDPIANVDGTVHTYGTGKNLGVLKSVTDYGAQTANQTDTIGKEHSTSKNEIGEKQKTHSVSPSDEKNTFYPKDKDVDVASTDTLTTDTDARTNKSEIKHPEHSDIINQSNGNDSEFDTTEERHGNIGVTTTQHLMTEEKDFWVSYYFADYIRKIIEQTICDVTVTNF